MKQWKGEIPSTWHEKVDHAASRCQAAALSLTSRRLHGRNKVCQVEGQKTGCCFASLGNSLSMGSSGCLKDGGLIALFLEPHRVDHPYPHIRQGTHGDRMAFSFLPLALIVFQCPRFGERRLPGKLLHGIAQRFDAGIAPMRFGIGATLEQDGRGPGQGLQAGWMAIACAIIPDFCQQARRKPLSSPGQTAEKLAVSMRQKKVGDSLVILRTAFNYRQQLFDKRHQEPRFRVGRDLVGFKWG